MRLKVNKKNEGRHVRFTKLHQLTGIRHFITGNDAESSEAADRVERCCRLSVARALRLPLLPLVLRADWLMARRYGVEAQTNSRTY